LNKIAAKIFIRWLQSISYNEFGVIRQKIYKKLPNEIFNNYFQRIEKKDFF